VKALSSQVWRFSSDEKIEIDVEALSVDMSTSLGFEYESLTIQIFEGCVYYFQNFLRGISASCPSDVPPLEICGW
jgi:hypothetical protein